MSKIVLSATRGSLRANRAAMSLGGELMKQQRSGLGIVFYGGRREDVPARTGERVTLMRHAAGLVIVDALTTDPHEEILSRAPLDNEQIFDVGVALGACVRVLFPQGMPERQDGSWGGDGLRTSNLVVAPRIPLLETKEQAAWIIEQMMAQGERT